MMRIVKTDKRLGRKHFIALEDQTVVNCCSYKKWAVCMDIFFFFFFLKWENKEMEELEECAIKCEWASLLLSVF